MACFYPIKGYRLHNESTDSGKKMIVFNTKRTEGKTYSEVDIPCGQCSGCRLDKSKAWASRCYHESLLYNNNCFITLTYDDDNLPAYCSLTRGPGSDFTNFMKRLRRAYLGIEQVNGKYPIRYFQCGEYGNDFERPHHHAILFNFDFMDKEYLATTDDGYKVYTSNTLEELWTHGICMIGEVTVQSAGYIARYSMKKVTGKEAFNHYTKIDEAGRAYEMVPEYVTMSRRPGIGKNWIDMFYQTDIEGKDFFTIDGKRYRVPRYYDEVMELADKLDLDLLKYERMLKATKHKENNRLFRLQTRKKCQEKRNERLTRRL